MCNKIEETFMAFWGSTNQGRANEPEGFYVRTENAFKENSFIFKKRGILPSFFFVILKLFLNFVPEFRYC